MQCPACRSNLVIVRVCRRVFFRCDRCKKEFPVHEVAHLLDEAAEGLLERYNCIIYD